MEFKGGTNVATAIGGAPGEIVVVAVAAAVGGGVDIDIVVRGGAMGET